MTYTTNIRLPDDLGEDLVRYSDETGVPRNTVVRQALTAFLTPKVTPRATKRTMKRGTTKRGTK